MTDEIIFNQRPSLCPSHGLSLGSDFLCLVCHLELDGKAPKAFERIPEGVRGTPSEEKGKKRRHSWKGKKKKQAKEVYEPITDGISDSEPMIEEEE